MVPSWVLSTLIIFAGCILACFVGSTLPEYDRLAIYILALAIACTVCAVTNNFPMLLALGIWIPFPLPIPGFSSLPTFALVLVWVGLITFFRMCLSGTIRYVPSYNVFLLIVFSWVPIRFLMNPIHKLGAGVEGGSGVSGATPYFLYVIAAVTLVALGAILNTREKLVLFMRWSFRIVLFVGTGFFICAFIPATGPFLVSMGSFAAGNMGDGIQRFVQLPGYGIFILQAALCPDLFRLNKTQCTGLFLFGAAMMVLGGNRSTVAAAVIAIPVILFLRRKTHSLLLCICVMIAGVCFLRVSVAQMDMTQISPLTRSLGIFDSKIDEASGGTASANWRYAVWQSGIDKIMENPMVGKGFGNLPKYLDPNAASRKGSTDYETLLAGGEAHNGFITAAYGFGIPFMLGLTVAIVLALVGQMRAALATDRHDRELRDLHALLACMFATFPMHIYTAFDMSVTMLWIYMGMAIILNHLPKSASAVDHAVGRQSQIPLPSAQAYNLYPNRPAPGR